MWRKIAKIWNLIWGIIGGIAILVGLAVGFLNLRDRFNPTQVDFPIVKEYIFGTKFYFVQVLTDDIDKIIAYGVTTRDKNFNPTFTILENVFNADINDPTNESKYKSAKKIIILGKTKFRDLQIPENIFAHLGAHDFYYHEEYYYGNPGNYQSYFFSANQSGYLNVDYDDLSFFNEDKIDSQDNEVIKFRSSSQINTFYVTAPEVGWNNIMLRKYLVGPDYYQIRVITDTSMPDVLDKNIEYNKLSKLSTNLNIENIISIFGKPLIINKKPTFDLRTDKPMGEISDKYLRDDNIFEHFIIRLFTKK